MGRWRDRVDWSVVIVAATLLVVTLAFGAYLDHRRAVSDERNERQRVAICTILAALPPSPPPALQAARAVFARPGHRRDCQPVARPSSTPRRVRPTPTSTVTVRPQVFVVPTAAPSASSRPRRPSPAATGSAHPAPTPSRTPSPSPTCVLVICLAPR